MDLLASLSPTQKAVAGAAAVAAAYRVWSAVSALHDDRHTELAGPAHRALRASGASTDPGQAAAYAQTFFQNAAGLWIYTRSWRAPAGKERGVVFLLHGLGEHCGRYEHVAARLNAAGLSVYAMDHQGHGQSGGDRAHVRRFDDYVDDADAFVRRAMEADGFDRALPRFLFGHSMGGLMATLLALRALDRGEDGLWTGGVILSGPALMVDPNVATPTLQVLARLMSSLAPKLEVGDAIPPEHVSRDPHTQFRYATDPLVYHGRVRARLGAELLAAIDRARAGAPRFTWPLIVLQGGQDKLVAPRGGEDFVSGAASEDKRYRLYPELYHELVMEPEFDSVVSDIIGWVTDRL